MSVFVDASVLVAIMAEESGYHDFLLDLRATTGLLTSPVAIWETVRATARILKAPVSQIHAELMILLKGLNISIIDIGVMEAEAAVIAHQHYGKGNHIAKLNMGDCFAYACAKTNGARLLYKGDDFARTDMA